MKYPPRLARWIISKLDFYERNFALADALDEDFIRVQTKRGSGASHLWYWYHTFVILLQYIKLCTIWGFLMFSNYIKLTFRNIRKRKGYAFINIFGLAIGMAVCMILIQYIIFELSYDSFHDNADRIYRLEIDEWAGSHGPAGQTAKDVFPEVEDYVKINTMFANGVFSRDNITFKEDRVYFATPSFLSVFSFPIITGDPITALSDKNTIVLTESTAKKYFGDNDPIGQALTFAGRREYKITGIIADPPPQSHMKFDILVSNATLDGDWVKTWYYSSFHTYLLMKPGADTKSFEKKYQAHIEEIESQLARGEYSDMAYHLQPLKSIHLHGHAKFEIEENGDIKTVSFLVCITLLILASAWINYINLSTARSLERAKEIGIRKVLGAFRINIMRQFLLESACFNLISVGIALIFVKLSLPFFHQITGIPLSFSIWSSSVFWGIILGMMVLGIFLSGFYPSLVLSAFKPVHTLKGQSSKVRGGTWFRKSLIIFQFAVSVALIAGTFTVYRQMTFMKNQDLGFGLKNTLVVKSPGVFESNSRTERAGRMNVFKTELKKRPDIQKAAVSRFVPGEEVMNIHGGRRIFEPKEKAREFHIQFIDHDYIDFYGVNLLAGRNFHRDLSSDQDKLILNEAALYLLDFENPEQAIGERIYHEDQQCEIVGVIENYHQQSLKYDYVPLLINNFGLLTGQFSIKLHTRDLANTIHSIKNVWEDVFPGNPFDYFFLDEHFNRQYQTDMRFGQLSGLFTLLAIIIGCMGLFGLSSLNVSVRMREVGIRKTLGASVPTIIHLLIKDFLKLIGIAVLIALPISYFYFKNWLTNYAFQTEIGWWFFGIPIFVILLIAIFTVFFQVIRAAIANPVNSLRHE